MVNAMKRSRQLNCEDSLTSDEPTLDISSLIDVCFLLLIYFIVTTTIQPREQDLRMVIPSTHGGSITIPPMVIEVRQAGEVVVNPGDAAEVYDRDADARELPNLKNRLSMLSGMGRAHAPKVLLKVHDEVDQQRYVDVLNCLSGAGIREIALQN
jgi:biopolymer transport protein ExbD